MSESAMYLEQHDNPNLVQLREWQETEGHALENPDHPDWGWAWPAPPEFREYRVEGQMRSDVLVRVDRPSDDPCEVRLVQGWIEGGYSEFTVEHEYPIEVWIHEGRQSQKVWSHDWEMSETGALAAFLAWIAPTKEDGR